MPHTIDLGLMALATSEATPVPSSREITCKFSTMLSHCDNSAITHTSSIPSTDTAAYPSTSAPRTRVAIRRDGQPALMSTHDQTQDGERNVSFRARFLRSTFFCAPLRCGSNSYRLPMTACRIGTPGPTFQRATFVSLRPHTPNSQPTLAFPPISGYEIPWKRGSSTLSRTGLNY